jgi:uncharacterized Zn finger protein
MKINVEKLFSNHKCDKCKKEKALHGVFKEPKKELVLMCDKCFEKFKYQDAIDELFHY